MTMRCCFATGRADVFIMAWLGTSHGRQLTLLGKTVSAEHPAKDRWAMTVRTQCLNASRYAAGLAAAIALFSASAPPRAADVTVLPNGWRVTPAGSLSPLGTLPLHMAQDATGRWLAITNAGFSKQSVVVVDEGNGRVTDSRPIERTFFGVAFSPDGRALYVSSGGDGGVLRYPFDPGSGKLSDPAVWPVGVGKLFAGGIAVSSNGKS